ncbi:hypothetical protein HUN42_00019 [Streptomyces phage Dagobah]|nr:hypothetical protein HUN42_00019 [Streptomyces phage Dagobah]
MRAPRPARSLGPENMQTFAIQATGDEHWRRATCEEVRCRMAARGWEMRLDLTTELGQRQARYIKHQSGRRYEIVDQKNGLVTLRFPGGQECFKAHRVRTDAPGRFLVKGGDRRGNPRGTVTRVHKKPEFWVEEFQENSLRLIQLKERG